MIHCPRCSGLLRVDIDNHVSAIACMACGARTYPPFEPFTISTIRLAQALYCGNCQLKPSLVNKTLCSTCMGARITQGKNTAQKNRERRAYDSPPPQDQAQ